MHPLNRHLTHLNRPFVRPRRLDLFGLLEPTGGSMNSPALAKGDFVGQVYSKCGTDEWAARRKGGASRVRHVELSFRPQTRSSAS
ncbi:hypothetical protein PQX77_020391 [Marasmius sp. AFHP31]|nr:hypothetical protein PQX77_020391 [Marasmius sp. AFHP31]